MNETLLDFIIENMKFTGTARYEKEIKGTYFTPSESEFSDIEIVGKLSLKKIKTHFPYLTEFLLENAIEEVVEKKDFKRLLEEKLEEKKHWTVVSFTFDYFVEIDSEEIYVKAKTNEIELNRRQYAY